MNVAVHLRRFGIHPKIVSRVGTDELGDQLLEFLTKEDVDLRHIQRDRDQPTGVVNVQIADSGDATYDIVYPSAWDFIETPADLLSENYDVILVFGSLASRNEVSRRALFKILDKVNIALFDVNFRAPHFTQDLVEELLRRSQIVKLNEHEIKIIGNWLKLGDADDIEICQALSKAYSVPHIILTMGADGAMVLKDDQFFRHQGFKVQVKDTIGSGDSFLASYLAHFLAKESVERCLEMASATGALVASCQGAVPDYGIKDILALINKS